MSRQCLRIIQKTPVPHPFFRVIFLFTFGRLPISFEYCSNICFAFAIFSSGSHVLSFPSQPSHFTLYSQQVLSELSRCFVIYSTTYLVPAQPVWTRGGGSRQAILEISVRSTLSRLTLAVSYIVMSFGRSSLTAFPLICRISYGPT